MAFTLGSRLMINLYLLAEKHIKMKYIQRNERLAELKRKSASKTCHWQALQHKFVYPSPTKCKCCFHGMQLLWMDLSKYSQTYHVSPFLQSWPPTSKPHLGFESFPPWPSYQMSSWFCFEIVDYSYRLPPFSTAKLSTN